VFALAILVRDGKPALRNALALCAAAASEWEPYFSITRSCLAVRFNSGTYRSGRRKRLNTFDTPLWKGLYGFLLSPGKSVFIFAPPLLLALAGCAAFGISSAVSPPWPY